MASRPSGTLTPGMWWRAAAPLQSRAVVAPPPPCAGERRGDVIFLYGLPVVAGLTECSRLTGHPRVYAPFTCIRARAVGSQRERSLFQSQSGKRADLFYFLVEGRVWDFPVFAASGLRPQLLFLLTYVPFARTAGRVKRPLSSSPLARINASPRPLDDAGFS